MKQLITGIFSLLIISIFNLHLLQVDGDTDMIQLVPPYGEIVGEPTEEIWVIAPHTSECMGVAPMTCMQVKMDAEESWQNQFNHISNFAYEAGFTYEIRVLIAELTDVPADASTQFVQLVEIMRKDPLTLTNHVWELETLYDEPVTGDQPITIELDKEGNLAGSGGCNQYSSSYTIEDNSLSLDVIAVTRMACPNMEQESTYLTALEEVARYEIESGRLTLYNAENEAILVFHSA